MMKECARLTGPSKHLGTIGCQFESCPRHINSPAAHHHSPEIIRRADVVWIQTNCIGHKSYYNIIDLARKYDRKVRYFKYASASKCAEQIVEEENTDE